MIALYLYLACGAICTGRIVWNARRGVKTWMPQWGVAAIAVALGLAWPLVVIFFAVRHMIERRGPDGFVTDVERDGTAHELRSVLASQSYTCPTCNGNNVLTGVVRELVHIECDDGAKHEVKSKARFYCDDCKVAYGREP